MAFRRRGAGPLGEARCYLPLAVPECALPPGADPPPIRFTFSPTPSDSIAWGMPNVRPSTMAIRSQLGEQCAGATMTTDDVVYVDEGLHTAALREVADLLAHGAATRWDEALYGAMPARDGVHANLPQNSSVNAVAWGATVEGVVPIVDGCAEKFTGALPIEGFAWAVVFDVAERGGAKNLFVQLDTTHPHPQWGPVDPEGAPTNVSGTGGPQIGEW